LALLACVADDLAAWQTPYIWKRRADGLYVINLAKTWEKLMLAARVIVAIENPQDGEAFAMC
jgi:ribosomal protein S2